MRHFSLSKEAVTVLGIILTAASSSVTANNAVAVLPFFQDWSDTGQITILNDWTNVHAITGYDGNGMTNLTGADPQTLLAPDLLLSEDVIPHPFSQANNITSGVGEFEGAIPATSNPVVALRASPVADAPYLLLNLHTSPYSEVLFSYVVRDMDATPRDAITPVALQYRLGMAGNFINIPEAYVADATDPNTATKETQVSVILPPAGNNPVIQLRIITANANGLDEWVGIDEIYAEQPRTLTILDDVTVDEGNSSGDGSCVTKPLDFTVISDIPAPIGGTDFVYYTKSQTATAADNDFVQIISELATIPEGEDSTTITAYTNCDDIIEPDEYFFVRIQSVPWQPSRIDHGSEAATILNDD